MSRVTEYLSCMPAMLKKLYLTLKGYDKVPPSLTDEYMEVMKKSKGKGITWSDEDTATDAQFKTICTLDLDKPHLVDDDLMTKDSNLTIDSTDSDDCSEADNLLMTSTKKRKGTPIKLTNNETIVINDSLEFLDTTRYLNSAKKLKIDFDIPEAEAIDPKDLNSTFVMAGKMEPFKLKIKSEKENVPVRRALADGTNMINQRTGNFVDRGNKIYVLVFLIN